MTTRMNWKLILACLGCISFSLSLASSNFPLGQLSQLKATSTRTILNSECLLCRGDSLSSGRTSALAAFIEVVEHDLLHDSSCSSEKNSNSSSSEEDSVSSRKSSMESVISTDSSAMTDVNPELEVAANPNSRSNSSSSSQEGNNNSLPKEISCAELELLKKLEEQNR